MRFDKTALLSIVQQQCGDDQAALALGELRLLHLPQESWKLLSGRVQAKLADQEVARFADALRVYATKARVNEYNHSWPLQRRSRYSVRHCLGACGRPRASPAMRDYDGV